MLLLSVGREFDKFGAEPLKAWLPMVLGQVEDPVRWTEEEDLREWVRFVKWRRSNR